jgi:predicted RNase H-like HicB family nuclease
MKLYHVTVEKEGRWFVGRVLERNGITTQGRSLDELVFMVRDAIYLMWGDATVELELLVPSKTAVPARRPRQRNSRKSPKQAA